MTHFDCQCPAIEPQKVTTSAKRLAYSVNQLSGFSPMMVTQGCFQAMDGTTNRKKDYEEDNY
jgi:hypothetical protein